jgi:hypothetical protein
MPVWLVPGPVGVPVSVPADDWAGSELIDDSPVPLLVVPPVPAI